MLRKTKETFSFCPFLSRPYRKFPGKLGVLGKRSTRQHIIRRKSISYPAHSGMSCPVPGAAGLCRRSERSPALPSVNVGPTGVGRKGFAGLIIGPTRPGVLPADTGGRRPPRRGAHDEWRGATGKAGPPAQNEPLRATCTPPSGKVAAFGRSTIVRLLIMERYRPISWRALRHHDQNLGPGHKAEKIL